MLRICFAPRVAVGRVRNLEAYVFRSLGFSVARPERMFWQLLPASVIGGEVYRLPPIGTDEWMDKNLCFDKKHWTDVAMQCSAWRSRLRGTRFWYSSGHPMSGTKLTWPIRSTQKRLFLRHDSHGQGLWLEI